MEQYTKTLFLMLYRKVKQIIRQNADSCFLAMNVNGEIPLHIACKLDEKHYDLVELLLGYNDGSDGINYKQKEQLEAVNEIFGNTPLHVAACLGNKKIVNGILKCQDGISLLEKKNKLRDTPVHAAASRGHLRWVKYNAQHLSL